MPTKKQVIEKVGQEMWDKMCATGWLDGITTTVKRALCNVACSECGFVKTECINPYTAAGVKGGKIAPGFSRGVELHPLFPVILLSTINL